MTFIYIGIIVKAYSQSSSLHFNIQNLQPDVAIRQITGGSSELGYVSCQLRIHDNKIQLMVLGDNQILRDYMILGY